MLLFCGIPSETPLQLAIDSAAELGIEHVVFNQREARYADMRLEVGDGGLDGILHLGGCDYPLKKFRGVYARLTDAISLPEHRPSRRLHPDPEPARRSACLHAHLSEWLELSPCRIVNRAAAMASNISKPYQSQHIARAGFQIPPTLVSNDPEVVRRFASRHGRLIYKSISSTRSIVRELDAESEGRLERIRQLPTQFQALIEGVNIRVHVVGAEVFATRILSEAVDYRYAQRDDMEVEMCPMELPSEITQRCLGLSRSLRLPFCGIDLILTPQGQYYCLEANPSPAYSYFQQMTGQPISVSLVKYLVGDKTANSNI